MTEQDAPASLKRRVEILEIGHAVLTRQQSETAVALRDIAACLQQGTATMAGVQAELRSNSKITDDVRTTAGEMRDILSTAKAGLRFLGVVGIVAKWSAIIAGGVTSLIVLWHTIKNGGKPPGV